MNKYFGTASAKTSKKAYEKNKALAGIRVAIINGKVIMIVTRNPEKWHTILRTEFPNVKLKIVNDGIIINEKS